MPFDSSADQLEHDDADRAAGWGAMTPEQLRRRVANLDGHPYRVSFGRILAGAVKRHAPHLLGLVPPEWQAPDA